MNSANSDPSYYVHTDNENVLQECRVISEGFDSKETRSLVCDRPLYGRYIVLYKTGINVLGVCEIEAYKPKGEVWWWGVRVE